VLLKNNAALIQPEALYQRANASKNNNIAIPIKIVKTAFFQERLLPSRMA
jgi:hypothetical protein